MMSRSQASFDAEIGWHSRCPSITSDEAVATGLRYLSRLRGFGPPALATFERFGESTDERPASNHATGSGHPSIVFDRVSLAFDDDVVLRDVSFSVPSGSMKVLLGASGTGKSVILKLILGLLKPDAGTISLDGRRIDNLSETHAVGFVGRATAPRRARTRHGCAPTSPVAR
jgi:ABC-type multidrug transport system fused ATPase/permease subunit